MPGSDACPHLLAITIADIARNDTVTTAAEHSASDASLEQVMVTANAMVVAAVGESAESAAIFSKVFDSTLSHTFTFYERLDENCHSLRMSPSGSILLTSSSHLLHVGTYGQMEGHPVLARSLADLPTVADVELYVPDEATLAKEKEHRHGLAWRTLERTDEERARFSRGIIHTYKSKLFLQVSDSDMKRYTTGQCILVPLSGEQVTQLQSNLFRLAMSTHSKETSGASFDSGNNGKNSPSVQLFGTLRSRCGCFVRCFDPSSEKFVPLEKELEVWDAMRQQRKQEMSNQLHFANDCHPEVAAPSTVARGMKKRAGMASAVGAFGGVSTSTEGPFGSALTSGTSNSLFSSSRVFGGGGTAAEAAMTSVFGTAVTSSSSSTSRSNYAYGPQQEKRGGHEYQLHTDASSFPPRSGTVFIQWTSSMSARGMQLQPWQRIVMIQAHRIPRAELDQRSIKSIERESPQLASAEDIPVFHDTAQSGYDNRTYVCRALGFSDALAGRPQRIDFDQLQHRGIILYVQVANSLVYTYREEMLEVGQTFLESSSSRSDEEEIFQGRRIDVPDVDPLAPKEEQQAVVAAAAAAKTSRHSKRKGRSGKNAGLAPFVTLSVEEQRALSDSELAQYYDCEDELEDRLREIEHAQVIQPQQSRWSASNQCYSSFIGTRTSTRFLQTAVGATSAAADSLIPPLQSIVDEYATEPKSAQEYRLYINPYAPKKGETGPPQRSCFMPHDFFEGYWPLTPTDEQQKLEAADTVMAVMEENESSDSSGAKSTTRKRKKAGAATGGFMMSTSDSTESSSATPRGPVEHTLLDLVLSNGVVTYMPGSFFVGVPIEKRTIEALSDSEATIDIGGPQELVLISSVHSKASRHDTNLKPQLDDKCIILRDILHLITPASAARLASGATDAPSTVNLKQIDFSDPALIDQRYFLFVSVRYPKDFTVNPSLHTHYLIADKYEPRSLLSEWDGECSARVRERHLRHVAVHEEECATKWDQETKAFQAIWTSETDHHEDSEEGMDEESDEQNDESKGNKESDNSANDGKPISYLVTANPLQWDNAMRDGASYRNLLSYISSEGEAAVVTAAMYVQAKDLWNEDSSKWTRVQVKHVERMDDLLRVVKRIEGRRIPSTSASASSNEIVPTASSVLLRSRPWAEEYRSHWVMVAEWVVLTRQDKCGFYSLSPTMHRRISEDVARFDAAIAGNTLGPPRPGHAEINAWFEQAFGRASNAHNPEEPGQGRRRRTKTNSEDIKEKCFGSNRERNQNSFFVNPRIEFIPHDAVMPQ